MAQSDDTVFDRNKPISLYYQLQEKLSQKIQSGEWKSGQKIPTETELCSIYGLSRITVRKAVEELVHEGRLIRFQGKGTFVASINFEQKLSKFYSFSEALKKKGKNEHVKMLSFDIIKSDAATAAHLGLGEDAVFYKITRLRMVDDTAYTVETSLIPHALCPRLAEKSIIEKGLYNSMADDGVVPKRIVEKFRAAAIRAYEAKYMDLKIGTPAIHLERTTYDSTRIIEYCVSIVRGDFFTYTVEMKS
ncbi:GntR family transcriptional regulator [Leadbettera azotonutricia]|uniref:Transcriptional regulator, GntR family n=1 Tax=Leadbettera azotonutricia (strain ATCC BAA-888 / DSM 13862 / ZAS-9) TaxID=545695 RepID=F5YGE2_LEAAZ|nr:GntR family transcriptional regulator [Leadbettera azotonutricia]AEF82210.1 transcriptional regulator, GntR family [Leadbettera azotonutricia ZAS-9]